MKFTGSKVALSLFRPWSDQLYLFGQMYVLAHKDERNYVVFGIISVVTAVVVYYLFGQVFHLMLPAGYLGLG